MTDSDENFEEEIWFGLMNTFNGEFDINKIIIIDTDRNWKQKLLTLIEKFERAYFN